jgi:tight adherence protein C
VAFALVVTAVDPPAVAAALATVAGRVCLVAGLALDGIGLAWMRHLLAPRPPRGLAAELPEVIDLFVLALGAGLTVHAAVRAVAAHGHGSVGAALRRAVVRVDAGLRLTDELTALESRLGADVGPLVHALVAALHDGAPVVPALHRLADDHRRHRQAAALEAARRVPVLLLFPLVICVLPAFVLLTVAPLVSAALATVGRA